MHSVNLTDKTRNALLHAVEVQIDILNDTIFENFPFNANDIRRLAAMSDLELDVVLREMHTEANKQFDELEQLQQLYNLLKNS